jgi:hypothetical protein
VQSLKETTIDFLVKRFGGDVKIDSESTEFARFDPKHPDVGGVVVEEDASELIVYIGGITHGHFGSYNSGLSEAEHQKIIAQDLVDFLVDLFADGYFLFKSERSGGWTHRDLISDEDMESPQTEWFLWSGPILRDAQSNAK